MKDFILERRSIRKYDAKVKISKDELKQILTETLRAPSSQNLQPCRFFVVESDQAKEKLKEAMPYNRLQLETSSQMILLFVEKDKYVFAETIFTRAVEAGYMPDSVKQAQLQRFKEAPINIDNPRYLQGLFLDAGLMAMQLMLIAKKHGYDTCAIGGFNRDVINDVMGIDNKYMPALIISIGKADETGYESVRLTVDETTKWL